MYNANILEQEWGLYEVETDLIYETSSIFGCKYIFLNHTLFTVFQQVIIHLEVLLIRKSYQTVPRFTCSLRMLYIRQQQHKKQQLQSSLQATHMFNSHHFKRHNKATHTDGDIEQTWYMTIKHGTAPPCFNGTHHNAGSPLWKSLVLKQNSSKIRIKLQPWLCLIRWCVNNGVECVVYYKSIINQ